MPETAEEKKFRIQQGVVKRLIKEHSCYIEDAKKGEQEISVMKNTPDHDEYMLKKMGERVEESRAMISDACRRLCVACEDLRQAIDALGRGDDDEQVAAAKALIETSRVQVSAGEVASRSL